MKRSLFMAILLAIPSSLFAGGLPVMNYGNDFLNGFGTTATILNNRRTLDLEERRFELEQNRHKAEQQLIENEKKKRAEQEDSNRIVWETFCKSNPEFTDKNSPARMELDKVFNRIYAAAVSNGVIPYATALERSAIIAKAELAAKGWTYINN